MTTAFDVVDNGSTQAKSETVGYEVRLNDVMSGYFNIFPNSALGIVMEKVGSAMNPFEVIQALVEKGYTLTVAIKGDNPTKAQETADAMLSDLGL